MVSIHAKSKLLSSPWATSAPEFLTILYVCELPQHSFKALYIHLIAANCKLTVEINSIPVASNNLFPVTL